MAEAIGIASGLLAIVGFAWKSALSLHVLLKSIQNAPESICDLKDELEVISNVLQSLLETIYDDDDAFMTLKNPIFRCGRACGEFKILVSKFAADGSQTSKLKEWAKLRFMGEDIAGFKDTIARYKATISIAIGDANLRKMEVSAQGLKDLGNLISNTKSDLEQHFKIIHERLETISQIPEPTSGHEHQKFLEEMESMRHCIKKCEEVSEHIDRIQSTINETVSSKRDNVRTTQTIAELVTAHNFRCCKNNLLTTVSQLKDWLEAPTVQKPLLAAKSAHAGPDKATEKQLLEAELESITQRIAYLSQAASRTDQYRTNHFENVVAAKDSRQVVVSTVEVPIFAKEVRVGPRGSQCLGQLPNEFMQQWSKDCGQPSKQDSANAEIPSLDFEIRHSVGKSLESGSTVVTKFKKANKFNVANRRKRRPTRRLLT